MANERLIHLESDYEYVIGSVMGNVLNLQAAFPTMEWSKSDLQLISKELVNTAKLFAAQQGLSSVNVINDVSVYGNPVQIQRKKRHRTGTLIRSIHADVVGHTINFFNNANLGRGFYAGHIEYGFHDRAGNPVAARPFMRPAFQAVARASRGKLAGTLQSFLKTGLFQNVTAKFGTPMTGGALRAFYNQPRGPIRGAGSGTYTTQGLMNSRMNKQGLWGNVNSRGKSLGTVRDNSRKGFIGRQNNRTFMTGKQVTSSTKKYGTRKWGNTHGTTPRSYKGHGKMNKNIPGRSKIKSGSSKTSKKSKTTKKESKQTKSKKSTSKSYKSQNSKYGGSSTPTSGPLKWHKF